MIIILSYNRKECYMNNIELELKIKEIISERNYFTMVMAAKAFEPEYKRTDFYKETKMPLQEVIKECKIYYFLQLDNLAEKIQLLIDNLSVEKINAVVDQLGEVFAQENTDIKEALETFKDIVK